MSSPPRTGFADMRFKLTCERCFVSLCNTRWQSHRPTHSTFIYRIGMMLLTVLRFLCSDLHLIPDEVVRNTMNMRAWKGRQTRTTNNTHWGSDDPSVCKQMEWLLLNGSEKDGFPIIREDCTRLSYYGTCPKVMRRHIAEERRFTHLPANRLIGIRHTTGYGMTSRPENRNAASTHPRADTYLRHLCNKWYHPANRHPHLHLNLNHQTSECHMFLLAMLPMMMSA